MPANLTPEYLEAENRFKSARTTEEKIAALELMLATIPRHKGTEKLQGDIKHRLSKLRAMEENRPASRAGLIHRVPREGAGQVALVGPPNSGKSMLVRRLSRASTQVGDYPFTTRVPVPGMMAFEDVQIQLVDLPPAHPDFPESWVGQIIRNADAAMLVIDLSDADLLEDLEITLGELRKAKVHVGSAPHHMVRGSGSQPNEPGWLVKPTLTVGNKVDRSEAPSNLRILCDLYGDRFLVLPVSARTGEGLENLRRSVFDLLGLVRVYTKAPGKKGDLGAPYILRRGARLVDLAGHVHKDFLSQLKFARVWGHGKFEGQMVTRDYVLSDKDVVELHR